MLYKSLLAIVLFLLGHAEMLHIPLVESSNGDSVLHFGRKTLLD